MYIWQREVEHLTVLALLTLKSVPNVRMEEAFFFVCPASKCTAPLQLNDSLPGSWQVSPPVPWLHMHHWNEILRPRFTLSYFSISFLRFYYQTPYPFLAKCPLLSLFYPTVFYPSPWFLLLFTSSKIHSISHMLEPKLLWLQKKYRKENLYNLEFQIQGTSGWRISVVY